MALDQPKTAGEVKERSRGTSITLRITFDRPLPDPDVNVLIVAEAIAQLIQMEQQADRYLVRDSAGVVPMTNLEAWPTREWS